VAVGHIQRRRLNPFLPANGPALNQREGKKRWDVERARRRRKKKKKKKKMAAGDSNRDFFSEERKERFGESEKSCVEKAVPWDDAIFIILLEKIYVTVAVDDKHSCSIS
jgi:hypothetical protein